MLMKTLNVYPVRYNDIICHELDGEMFLMSKDGSQIHLLNKTACLAWTLSDGRTKVEDIISQIMDEFNVAYEIAKRDVLDFFQDLKEKKLAQLLQEPIHCMNSKNENLLWKET